MTAAMSETKRWEQHVASGGKLTLEQFIARDERRNANRRLDAERKEAANKRQLEKDLRGVPKSVRRELATEIFDDLPDGAFFAASEDVFGLGAEDWA